MSTPEFKYKFNTGDKVIVKHQKELGTLIVNEPCVPTNLKRIGGEPIGYYVRVGDDNLGYHESSLELSELTRHSTD